MNAQRELRNIFLKFLVLFWKVKLKAFCLPSCWFKSSVRCSNSTKCSSGAKCKMEEKRTTIFTVSSWFKFPGRNINCTKTVSTVQNSKWKSMTIFTARKVVASINIWVKVDKNYRDTLCNHSHRHHTQDWESTQGVTKTHLDKTFQWTWILWTLDKLSNQRDRTLYYRLFSQIYFLFFCC